MVSFLQQDLATVALCWRLERRDGVALGFTTHDRDLSIGGLTYRAAPGMLPSEIMLTDGFDLDTLDVEGALTSDAITAADLKAGRWDGASVRVFMVDWENPAGETLHLARGELGEVSIKGEAFEAELKGPTAALDRPVVEQTSPECRASLGDRRCRVNLAGRTYFANVVEADDETLTVAFADLPHPNPSPEGEGPFAYGRLRWLSGPNSGLESAVMTSTGALLTLRDPPAFPAAAGDLVEIVEGCDRRLATCIARFANAENFRGEPHLPGIDLLTRYPGA